MLPAATHTMCIESIAIADLKSEWAAQRHLHCILHCLQFYCAPVSYKLEALDGKYVLDKSIGRLLAFRKLASLATIWIDCNFTLNSREDTGTLLSCPQDSH